MDRRLPTDADRRLRPGRGRRAPWLREALPGEGDPPPSPPLRGAIEADVAIIGVGHTGLWTAYQLFERLPDLGLFSSSPGICGGGPVRSKRRVRNSRWDEASRRKAPRELRQASHEPMHRPHGANTVRPPRCPRPG